MLDFPDLYHSITLMVRAVQIASPSLAQPDPDRLVRTRGGEALAVGAERHAGDAVGMATQREQFLARGGVPDLDRPVIARGSKAPAVGAEGHTVDAGEMPAECQHFLGCSGVPDLDGLVSA